MTLSTWFGLSIIAAYWAFVILEFIKSWTSKIDVDTGDK